MVQKKTVLFSLSLLLFVSTNVLAQQGSGSSATTPPAAPRADTQPMVSIGFGGGNYLGIAAEEVTRANMGRYGLREPRGVVVTRVGASSPAGRAGLKAGDVILRFDGEQVTTYRKLQRLISEAAPEQTVRLTISRNGAEQELSVTLARRDDAQSFSNLWGVEQSEDVRRSMEEAQQAYGNLAGVGFGWGRRIGISTTQLTRQLADYFGVSAGHGLLVTSVVENSPAARAGIKAGDVVTAVDGAKVETAGDLSRAVNRKTEGDVTLTIVRDRNQRSITVTPEKRDSSSITITPGAIEIEPIVLPSVDIRIPKIERLRPVAIPRITIPPVKINPVRVIGTEPLLIL